MPFHHLLDRLSLRPLARDSHRRRRSKRASRISHRRRAIIETLENRKLLAAFLVNTGGDSGDGVCDSTCTVRDAILAANALSDADTINFDSSVTGTITLSPSAGQLLITGPLAIAGPGSAALTLRAGTGPGNEFRVIDIAETAGDVTIEGLTLTGGRVTGDVGGGIRRLGAGTLTIRDSVITGNLAAGAGGIYNQLDGTVNISSSTISGNTAMYGPGGGIHNFYGVTTLTSSVLADNVAFNSGGGLFSPYNGAVIISDTEITGNRVTEDGYHGGGVYSGGGSLTISGSTISGNTSVGGDGGGLYNISGTFTIANSMLSENQANYSGGGIFNYNGTISLTDSTVSGNRAVYGDGGGISNGLGRLTLTRSTISGNSSVTDGGGVSNNSGQINAIESLFAGNTSGGDGGAIATITGGVTLTNSTLSGNAANVRGGGIQSDSAAVRLVSSTLTLNTANISGGGINVTADNTGESILIHNSIIAANASPSGADFTAPFNPAADLQVASSVIGNNDATTLLTGLPDADGNFIGSSISPVNPMLQPLASGGGPTLTHALDPGSVAIDAGDNTLLIDFGPDGAPGGGDDSMLANDQRGGLFLRIVSSGGGANTDIGAFEVQPPPTLTVDTAEDAIDGDLSPGDRSLRELVNLANTGNGFDTIFFEPGLSSPITLDPALGPIVVSDTLRIDGPGADQLTITKDPALPFRLFEISATAGDVEIRGLTLSGGNAGDADGGAILSRSDGELRVVHSELTGNMASSGAAIAATDGSIAIAGSTLAQNTATTNGGGIAALGTTSEIAVIDSTISGNEAGAGGGIYSENASVSIANSTITLNTAATDGGGIGLLANGGGESIDIDNSIIAGNSATDGDDFLAPLDPAADLDVDASLIGDNAGTSLTESSLVGGLPQPDASGNLIGGGANPIIGPLLGPLDSGGGPTRTHAPAEGSLAIDAGNSSNLPSDEFDLNRNGNNFEFLPVDQRGAPRVFGTLDMGAVELAAIPSVTWADPAAISFGTALSDTQLNAMSSEIGSFTYTPGEGTVLDAGDDQVLSARFIPNNPLAFRSVTATVMIDVLQADPIVTWADPDPITFGTALSSTQLNAAANLSGMFTYDPDFSAVLDAGNQTLSVTFTPDDTNFKAITETVTLVVNPADPGLAWSDPAGITFGTPLTSTQLNATADVSGTYVYTPPEDTVLAAGEDQVLSVTFTPDSSNYSQATTTVMIDVVQVLDFGDAPGDYPVLLADDGARHGTSALILGATIDAEQDGQPSVAADGDGDDEDGVSMIASLVAASGSATTSSFLVEASAAGLLDVWIDFDGNNDWDAGEQIASSLSVAPGTSVLSFTVPDGAAIGSPAARFRLSTAGGLAPTGEAADGEVEDYIVAILDGSAADDAAVTLPAGTAAIDVNGGALSINDGQVDLFAAPTNSFGVLTVTGTGGDDNVTIDLDDLGSAGLAIDGQGGNNTIVVTGASLDLATASSVSARNFQTIDTTDASSNLLAIDAAAVAELSPQDSLVRIRGGSRDVIVFTDRADWRMTDPLVEGVDFIRVATNQVTGEVVQVDGPSDWQNPIEPSDVNNSGEVTAGDALVIINELGRRAYSDQDTQELVDAITVDSFPGIYYDQNGDGKNTALDALRVINKLAQISNSGERIGEGKFLLLPKLQERFEPATADRALPEAELPQARPLPSKEMGSPRPRLAVAVSESTREEGEPSTWAQRVDQLLSHLDPL